MCGRFTLVTNMDELQSRFGFEARDMEHQPRYNIAPSQQVLTVVNDGQRRAETMRWGLIPFWAQDPKIGYRMINAVGETAAAKPAFRAAFKRRRCLVLADGFFEWRKEGKSKIPNYIFLRSHEPFAFAGLWETWKSPEGETIRSCSIVTTKPNDFIAPIHNRMPVILSQETEPLWLDPMTEETDTLTPLLTPSPAEWLDSYVVSSVVNSPKNSGRECIEPATTLETTLRLF
jgi:putative SOS response-associated peptidase YedK